MKKANQILLLFLYCFAFYFSFAQDPITRPHPKTIVGKVVDSASGIPLSQVSVAVSETERSSTFLSTLSNDSGFFEINLFTQQQYLVTFSFIGYKTVTRNINSIPSDLGVIPLPSLAKLLKEVQVTTKKPIIEQSFDKLIYNVDADLESSTASILDILRKIPMLALDADDNLYINGNNNFRVLINGKPTSLFVNNPSMVFNSMPASIIKTIEVITTPSSRYEAEGLGGIINIITYKKSILGYNGGLNLRATNPKGLMANGNITMTKERFSIAGHIGYTTNTNPANMSYYYRKDAIPQNQLEQQGANSNGSKLNNWGSELNWKLNPFNLITASYSSYSSSGLSSYLQQAHLLDASNTLTQAYNISNEGSNESTGNDLAIEFEHDFRKNEAQQFILSYRRSKSKANSKTNLLLYPIVNFKDRESITNNDDRFNEHSVQTDLRLAIKQHSLELGASFITRDNSSDYSYLDKNTGTNVFVIDTSQSNNYNYQEAIFATYSTLNLNAKKWGIRAGVRMENASVKARFITSRTSTKQQYFNLLPSIIITRQLKGLSMLKLSYAQRIQRPDLFYLDPYINVSDPYNISYGNPNLQPALGHVFNLTYNAILKKVFININAAHQFTTNSIQQITVLYHDSISHTTFGNIGKNKSYNLSINGNTVLFRKLNINIGVSSNYMQYMSRIMEKMQLNEGLIYSISGSFNIRQKNWRAGINMSYSSPNILVQGRTASFIANSVAINRSFLKDKRMNVGLSVSNPFQQYRRSYTEISGLSFYQLQQSISVIRRFSLSFIYRFAKVQAGSKEL